MSEQLPVAVVYLAAPWVHKQDAQQAVQRLRAAGVTVRARWAEFVGDSVDPVVLRREASQDIDDILGADVLVVLNSALSEGKATEQGIAINEGMPIIGIGTPSQVFHYLPNYTWVPTLSDAINLLTTSQV